MSRFLLFSKGKEIDDLEVVKSVVGTARLALGDVLVFGEDGYKIVTVVMWMDGFPAPQVDYIVLPISLRCASVQDESGVINGSRTG